MFKPLITKQALGFTGSFLIHAAVIFGGAAVFVQPPQFGVETSSGGMEIHLTAAPSVVMEETTLQHQTEIEEIIPAAEEKKIETKEMSKPEEKSEQTGDGSSPIPGKDKTTLHTAGGALHEASPTYLKNPAPRYPAEARRLGQEGLVLLVVDVKSDGSVRAISIKKSSGFPLLDESAHTTVGKWRFHPAKAGGIALDSFVEVPVRFRLDDPER